MRTILLIESGLFNIVSVSSVTGQARYSFQLFSYVILEKIIYLQPTNSENFVIHILHAFKKRLIETTTKFADLIGCQQVQYYFNL